MKLIKTSETDRRYCGNLSVENMTPYYERWGEPVIDLERWMQITKDYDTYLILPEGSDKPVGFVSVQVDPSDPKALFLVEIQIEDGHRAEGAFKSIRPHVRKLMRDKGLNAITGSVHRDNPLVSFYEKIGYRKTGITATRYNIRKQFTDEELQAI